MTQPADLVLFNAAVLTMDPDHPRATAVAIRGGLIAAVGEPEEMTDLIGPDTRRVDARGGTVLPGLIESHIHLFIGAAALSQLSLFGVQGVTALRDAVRSYASAHPDLGIVLCNGADYTLLGDGAAMDRHVLDDILPDRPLALLSPDHHTVWANTAALRAAGLLQGRALPPGNEIVMGADGLAQGELREPDAYDPIFGLSVNGGRDRLGLSTGRDPVPPPDAAARAADKDVLARGLAHLASYGITSFQNMDGNRYTLELLSELAAEGRLVCRGTVPGRCTGAPGEDAIAATVALRRDFDTPFLSSGTLKFFIDGVLDSHTALMDAPYADRPDWRGEPRFTAEALNDLITRADAAGLQVAVHSIGDGATRMVLDAYAAARAANGPRDSRHRIEHLELVREADFARIRDLDVIASMQPPHPPGQCGLPLEPTLSRIGRANWPRAYAWRRMLDQGSPLILSSDWPVSAVDPWAAIHAAMTRLPWDDDQPDNRLTLQEALTGYTTAAAHAEFAESRKGMLRVGYLADVVLLDRDLTRIPAAEVADVQALLTICDGTVTFSRIDAA